MTNNDEIKIVYSNEDTPDKIITDIMDIEREVFSVEDRGEYDSIAKRFHSFKEMFVLAYYGDMLIGYMCFFPITKILHDKILTAEQYYDDDITPNDISRMADENYIFAISIALKKKWQHKGIGNKMMEAFWEKISEYEQKGNHVIDVLASVVTNGGENTAKKNGLLLYAPVNTNRDVKIYRWVNEK